MDASEFHDNADQFLDRLFAALEPADEAGLLEIEEGEGLLTIKAEASGKQWVISKHAPTQQVWLSSPVSGGLHFPYSHNDWQLEDGTNLAALLAQELATQANVTVVL